MAQTLSPATTGGSSGSWQNQAGGTENLHESIDEETTPNDSDYVWQDNASIGEYIEFPLEDPTGTQTGDNVRLDWRAADADAATTLTAELRQGSTVIAADSRSLGASLTTYQYTLAESEKLAIADWNNLRVRFVVSDPRTVSGGAARTLSDGRVRTVS